MPATIRPQRLKRENRVELERPLDGRRPALPPPSGLCTCSLPRSLCCGISLEVVTAATVFTDRFVEAAGSALGKGFFVPELAGGDAIGSPGPSRARKNVIEDDDQDDRR